jgi:hypothetical protein
MTMLVPWTAPPATVLAGLLLAATPAAAQGTAQQRSDCMGDALRFCSEDIPDVSKIESCLDHKLSQLSPACRAEFQPDRAKKTKLQREHFR